MEVPGERIVYQRSFNRGSAEDFKDNCEPCSKDGNFVEAAGYCQNCDEYLCDACMKHHCRPLPSRHHVLIDKQQMPKNKPKKSNMTLCTVSCDKHPHENLKFYCKKHDVTGCGDCFIVDHKPCAVNNISTLSDGYNSSKDYEYIVYKLEQLQTQVNKVLSDDEKTARDADTSIKKAVMNVKQYRHEVNTRLDETERVLLAMCDEIAKFNQLESKRASDQMKAIRTKLTSHQKRLTENIDNIANLFALGNDSRPQLVTFAEEVKVVKEPEIQCVEFMENASLIPTISAEESLGELQFSDASISSKTHRKKIIDMVPDYIKEICTDVNNGKRKNYISGMVNIRENIIACTDWFNNAVKLFDIERCELLFTVSLMDKPWDITSITDKTLAATLTNSQKIQFIEVTNNTMTVMENIDLKGKCRGIDCVDCKLVVTYEDPPKIEIVDFNGNVMRCLPTDNTENSICKCLYNVVMSLDGRSIYVSDSKQESIIKYALDGEVMATYGDPELKDPRGMFVCRDGSVLVCSSTSVHVISEECKKQKILVNEKDGVWFPQGICYDEDNGIICFRKYGDGLPDMIQTFRMT